MVAPIVSPSLFNAHALSTDGGRPHLRAGNHLRIAHHPLLGLPAAPFIVSRLRLQDIDRMQVRTTALWIDSAGRTLTPPFTIQENNPVTAHVLVAAGETCIWAEILADPSSSGTLGVEVPVPPTRGINGGVGGIGGIGGGTLGGGTIGERIILNDRLRDRLRDRFDRFPPFDRAPIPSPSTMRVECFVESPKGPAFSAARNEPRFAFAAPGIISLTITGRGTVAGMRWLDRADLRRLKFSPWRALNLPHEGGPRYLSVSNAVDHCENRTREAAPRRRPLQDTIGTAGPGGAPLHSESDELDRVTSLTLPLKDDIATLITDTSRSQFEHDREETLRDENGVSRGKMRTLLLQRVLQGTLDPGSASYLGYFTRDTDFPERSDEFVFYLVDGYFHRPPPPGRGLTDVSDATRVFHELLDRLPDGTSVDDPGKLRNELNGAYEKLRDTREGPDAEQFGEGTEGPWLRIGCVAIADMSAPPLPPLPPSIDSHKDLGWLPAPISQPRRQIDLQVSDGIVGGLLAGEKLDLGAQTSLNTKNPGGWHLPLSFSLEADEGGEVINPEPGTGFIRDTWAGPDQIRYSLCQQDRFGRWSEWTRRNVGPGARPAPPQPAFMAFYLMPAIADPMPAGQVQIRVPVPELASLPPAGLPIRHFRFQVRDVTNSTVGTSFLTSSETIIDPMNPPEELDFTFLAPTLNPTETRKLRIIAQWEDTDGEKSIDSLPFVLTIHDPRPPAQLSVPNTLLYAARPDVQGRALVEWEWSPMAGQDKVAVYYSDENRLTAFLEEAAGVNPAAQAALTAIQAAPTIADRAAVFRSNASLFKGFLFERLAIVPESVAGGKLRFNHYLSGSLKVLSFYRLSAETDNGSRVPLETLPMISFGVPNSDPPAKPMLDVGPSADHPGDFVADLQVRMVPGVTAPEKVRLRRSSLAANDPFLMPVVKEEPVATEEEDGFLVATVEDAGPLVIAATADLQPWVRYFWVAEVQGAPEPGSSIPGKWSPPSDPAVFAFTPEGPPSAPTNIVVTGAATGSEFTDVTIEFETSDTMNGGEFGVFAARVYRQLPDGPMELFAEPQLAGDGSHAVEGSATAESVPADTTYRLVIVDPVGRTSAPVQISGVTS